MATVLILCSLGLMGWSVLGLINPLRFAQGSRARAFGVGVIGFALLMVGGAMLPPTPEPTSTATSSPPEPVQESESSVDSDEPAEFSAHTKQLLALYKELHSFKDDPTFHEVGFGTCCRFHDWQTRVEALRSKAELETLADVGVLPGDLLMLGMEYMRSKGRRPTEYTETMEPHYESGLTALAVMGGSLMPDDPAEPASEEFAASAPASPTPPPPPRDSAPGAADGAPANNVTTAPSGSPASGNLTAAQRNAVRSANSYLQLSGFSRQGLIDQLSSEFGDRYSVGDATVAVDSLNTDWNAQAARSAVSYLELSGFSCQGLIDQLSSEAGDKYTVEQATYGATQAGIC